MKTISIHYLKKTAMALAIMLSCSITFGQEKEVVNLQSQNHYDGFYIGLNFGYQNLFGGALIDNLDVLAQESRLVMDFTPGFRKQILKNRVVVGVEFLLGVTDGDLSTIDQRNQSEITYENNLQTGLGLNAGIVLGSRANIHLFIYGQQARRSFDITIQNQDLSIMEQEDQQNFKRYGIGIEIPVWSHFSLRSMLGFTAVDFGELITNMDVEDKIDFNLGIVYQL